MEQFKERVSALSYIWQLGTATGNAWYELCYIDESVYPRYPFGYGLGYTSFEFTDMKLSDTSMTATGQIRVSCKVTNTGERAGQTVVQLYIRDLVGQIVRPVKELKGFEKITLNAGESRTVSFELPAELLAFYNEAGEKIIEPGRFLAWIGEHSDDERM